MRDDFSVDPECNQSTRKSQIRGHSKTRGTKIKGLHWPCLPPRQKSDACKSSGTGLLSAADLCHSYYVICFQERASQN